MNEAEKLLYTYYLEDNYEILNFNKNKSDLCYIFFSSNGLYKDRNDVEIITKMHNSGRYEWKYITSDKKVAKKAKKIIFLRDIFKIFYIRGVNNKTNSVDKIKDLLAKETKGMNIILAGSSAGAYMALLMGYMLPNTQRIISLGGVVDLENFRSFSSYLDDNLDKCDYVNISSFLFGNYWTINFYGTDNSYDKHSAELISNCANKTKTINVGFKDTTHAPRPSGDDLIKLLICKDDHLQHVFSRIKGYETIDKHFFSRINLGVIRLCINDFKRLLVKVFRK